MSFFLANCTSLEELRLNNNGLGPEGGKIIANGLKENRRKSQAAGKASVLRRVTIGRNRLENGSAVNLAEAFSLHENLEDVAFFQNGIRPEGITVLSRPLQVSQVEKPRPSRQHFHFQRIKGFGCCNSLLDRTFPFEYWRLFT